MKRTKLIAYIFNLYSMSAVAGYECTLQLAHTENLHQVVAEKVLTINKSEMRSGNMGTLFVESAKKKKQITLDINAVLSGWPGEEDANLVVIRKTQKKHSGSVQTISEIMNVQGNNQLTGWFDSYKLDVRCKVTG